MDIVEYRLIDFKRDKYDIPATVKYIEYDPTDPLILLFFFMMMVLKDI